jgi:hypothetical protein
MKTIVIEVDRGGSTIDLMLKAGANSGQAVLVLSEHVEIKSKGQGSTPLRPGFRAFVSDNGFPPRKLTEEAIVQILRENGGSVKIRDESTGWNIIRRNRGSTRCFDRSPSETHSRYGGACVEARGGVR